MLACYTKVSLAEGSGTNVETMTCVAEMFVIAGSMTTKTKPVADMLSYMHLMKWTLGCFVQSFHFFFKKHGLGFTWVADK